VRVVGQVGRGDPQRQRQMRAGPGQIGRGLGFGLDALGAEDLAEQRPGLLGMQWAQDQPASPVGGDQPGQAVAAGDRDQAAGAAGQQRADLVGAGRVVEQQQQPAAGRHRPVQAGRLLQVGRDLVHAQPVQQLAQRLDRPHLGGRRIATQVEVQLPVGELVGDLVGPVDGQGGLADPGHPGDHRHRQRGLGGGAAVGKQRVELSQVVGAADEPGDVGGELRRGHRR
jgi:hypothetical protein